MEMDLDLDDDDQFAELNAAFTAWLAGSSGVVLNPKIGLQDLRSSSAGRGVIALAPLAQDETVLALPRASVLSVANSELFEKLREELSTLDSWLALIIVLIYETRPSSPWKPYIDLLPRTFDTLMYWSTAELAELQGSAVVAKIGRAEADVVFREKLWPIVKKHQELFSDTEIAPDLAIDAIGSLVDAAHRMGSVIMSYSFELELPGSDSASDSGSEDEEEDGRFYKGMVPMADMLNADAGRNNCRLFQTPTTLEMRTTVAIPAGAELFNDYGALPRSDLLRRYGYITENYARHDVVEVSSGLLTTVAGRALDPEDRTKRIDFLLDEGVLDDAFDIGTDLRVPDDVLVVIGTLLHPREQWREVKPRKSEAVARVLLEVLETRLGAYESGVEEDEALLRDQTVQGRRRIAVEVRLGEKKIIVGALAKVREWTPPDSAKRTETDAPDGERAGKRAKR
ncbi:Ribosomal lysine N-methyltransferase 4 [Maublancomyces gigas]|uniref:Ribosomal lysine N-methyltransferase 4 n=1 Tax=Discina gigas TaxID=1032678 RepID=A0ABR3GE70_9PEZI